ncbi:phosphotransferase [uncultured Tateyamaria sp.]|uniref:phosphotransferase n=1 Tax=Tateyamaria sp. 1078 TaxID=3417464 RepID=UPI0026244978|nr:phosphotransferase [uncultured Tateyamaria sp.]
MGIGRDPRVKQALAAWADIAPSLDLDPVAFRSKLIWQKDEPTRSHVVLRLTGPRRLILKMVIRAPAADPLDAAVSALRDAHQRLGDQPKAHAPEVLFASDSVVLMTEAKGKTLEDHLTTGRAPAPLLRRAGAWLAAFHGTGPVEHRTYQPRFMLEHVGRMAQAVRAGDLDVAEPDLFLGCCAALPTRAVEGAQTISAAKHGDFNIRNLLLGPDGETGLDFKPLSTAPVGFDIARLLMDYAELHQPGDAVPAGAVLSPATCAAFFEGYTLVGQDDPAVQFLPHVQLLNDWRLIPAQPSRRSWRQAARMDAIAALARNVLAQT